MRFVCVLLCSLMFSLAGCGSGTTKQSKSYINNDGYPLDVCVVSNEKLGEMGDPHVFQYQGKTVKLCCASCLKEFNSDPAKYMKIIEVAEKKKGQAN